MSYTLALSHDVDELSWRGMGLLSREALSLYRALLVSNTRRLLRRRISVTDWLESLWLLVRLPLVILRILPDPLQRTLWRIVELERTFGARSTFFFLPFSQLPGHRPDGTPAPRSRACRYRLADHARLIRSLIRAGWEVGVHGIDCHMSADAARAERAELVALTGDGHPIGARMHWLYSTPALLGNLASARFSYDASLGYNDRIGFPRSDGNIRSWPYVDRGTGLTVVPLAIQDVALLRSDHMDTRPAEAWRAIGRVLDEARRANAVVTVLWHNDSFLPPRCWAGLYRGLLARAQADGAAIVTLAEAAEAHGN